MADNKRYLLDAAARILRPLVRIMLRNGATYGDLAELARWVFVDVAREDFALPGRKQSMARISVLTGLTRKEVARLSGLKRPVDRAAHHKYNRAARVIAGWRRDSRFTDGNGQPRVLAIDTDDAPSFADLVRAYSGDMPVRAVLDELERVGAARRQDDARIKLTAEAYVPAGDEVQNLHILGQDTELLLSTIDHNLVAQTGNRYFQRKVRYDNLPQESIPELRQLSAARAQSLLHDLDHHLAAADRDVNPDVTGSGRMVAGMGIYYFEHPWNEEDTEQ